jgi:hypothetical protein
MIDIIGKKMEKIKWIGLPRFENLAGLVILRSEFNLGRNLFPPHV